MSIEKLTLASPDLAADTLAQLKALVPQAFNLDGALNPDKLKEAIGAEGVVEKERFGLNWPGKQDALRAAARPTSATLRPEAGKSVNFDTTGNVIVEGDNLETLKVLQRAYHGKIKMVYIDPPYNTGKDFVYPDDYAEPLKAYLERTGQKDEAGFWTSSNGEASGRKHSNWLSMMAPRLMLARNLLREDGVIFVSIDDNEVHRLRMLMDEVFGEENFLANVCWQKKYAPSNDTIDFSPMHDFVLVYAKTRPTSDAGKPEALLAGLERSEETNSSYRNPDNDERGAWRADNYVCNKTSEQRPNLYYPVVNPNNGKEIWPSKSAVWRYSKERHEQNVKEKRIWWGLKGDNSVPAFKRFLSDVGDVVADTWWTHEDCGHNDEAKKELRALFPDVDQGFDTPKPVRLITRMLQLASPRREEGASDLILDFFAGSGTTAHAVMNLNAQDGGQRKFILVQIPEPVAADSPAAKAGFKTIADITRGRVQRAGKKLTEGAGLMAQNLDAGFRSFRLDSSNFREWNKTATPSDLLSQIAAHSDSTLSGRTEQDLLYEVLVKAGFSPATPVESFFVNSQACHGIHDGQWVLCLEAQVNLETLEAITALDPAPARVICLDGAFANDAAKANAAVFYRQKNIELRTV